MTSDEEVIDCLTRGNGPTAVDHRLMVDMTVYNSKGQAVRHFAKIDREPGNYVLEWDGKDDNGSSLSSGVYLFRMKAGSGVLQRKAVMIK